MEVSEMNLADGEYTVEVTMEGGSGRASIQSPTELTIENGQAQAEIVWSSSHYASTKDGLHSIFSTQPGKLPTIIELR